MKGKGKRVLSAILATAFALSSGITALAADNTTQPELGARVKDIITVDGYQFKDLNGNGALDPYEDWRLSAEERAADLVSKMTLAEKTGQMVIHTKSTPGSAAGREPTTDANIEQHFITHFVERASTAPSNIATYHNAIQAIAEGTRLGIPALWASNPRNENNNMLEFGFQEDVGTFSTFPSTLGIAAAVKGDVKLDDDYSLIEQFAEIVRQEWDAAGINKGYTYMADLAADPRWARNNGTFGDDPEFIGEIMYRLIQGLQNGDALSPGGVAQTTKHFPGGGAPLNGMDPHYAAGKWSIFTTPGSLETYHLVPWRRVIEANSSSIMPYYSQPHPDSAVQVVDGVALDFVNNPYGNAFNPEIVGTLLRDILDYQGYVNSDSNILVDKHWGFEDRGRPNQDRELAKEVIVAAVNAGTDMFSNYSALTGQFATQDIIAEAVNEGLITPERVDQAAYRILIETFRVGYFENPYRDPALADAAVNDSDHWATAYEAHQKSVVLLKNQDNTLPLTQDKLSGKTVYVEAFNTTAANSNSSTATAREAVETAFGITLTDDYTEADYAILFLYPASGTSQSSAPTAYPDMSFYQDRTLPRRDGNGTVNYTTLYGADKLETIYSDLSARGGKVITNMNFRTSWVVDQAERNTDALLVGFDTYLAATLDVISGEYNPTGALPFALPASDEVLAIDENDACASPNDVPGHFKSLYMDGDYVYVDQAGNEYTVDFGLRYGDDVGTRSALTLGTTAHNVQAGEFIPVTVAFNEEQPANTVILNFTFDAAKFRYNGYNVDKAEGVSLVDYQSGEGWAKVTLMAPGYDMEDLGYLGLVAKEDATLARERQWVNVTAEYVLRDEDGGKSVAEAKSKVSFTTGGSDPDLLGDTNGDGVVDILDLSNMIDWFGYTRNNQSDWDNWYSLFDFNNNGEIDISDITKVARMI